MDTHPGLTFLKDAPEFHSRYITTVGDMQDEGLEYPVWKMVMLAQTYSFGFCDLLGSRLGRELREKREGPSVEPWGLLSNPLKPGKHPCHPRFLLRWLFRNSRYTVQAHCVSLCATQSPCTSHFLHF